jgi:hypothetical protein
MKTNSNYKVAVHITFFLGKNYLERLKFLKKIVKNYKNISKKLDIFIHTNKNLDRKYKIKNVNYIVHNLMSENPIFFPWKCRDLIYKQKEIYDFFIYSEDDILFTKKNFDYWLYFKDICIKNNFNLGFIRVENKNKNNFTIDVTTKLSSFIYLNKNRFIVNNVNPYCAFWIYDRQELNKFITSNIWKFNWRNEFSYGPIEMSAIGWHGIKMTRYIDTIIPLIKNYKKKYIVNPKSMIYHLSGNYNLAHKSQGKDAAINNLVDENQFKYNIIYNYYKFYKLKFKNTYCIYLIIIFLKRLKLFFKISKVVW